MEKLKFKKFKDSILKGKIICFPTETVFGLGVAYNNENAYHLLNKVKGRPEDKPYTMMLGSTKDISEYAYLDDKAIRLINAFMPGSLTLLLKAKNNVPSYVTHGTGIIGIRVPDYPLINEMLNFIGIPLLVPSANKSGENPALTVEDAKKIFKDEVSLYIEGSISSGKPSTIVDLTHDDYQIIRVGSILESQIQEVLK